MCAHPLLGKVWDWSSFSSSEGVSPETNPLVGIDTLPGLGLDVTIPYPPPQRRQLRATDRAGPTASFTDSSISDQENPLRLQP